MWRNVVSSIPLVAFFLGWLGLLILFFSEMTKVGHG